MNWAWILLIGVAGWLSLNALFVGWWIWLHSRPTPVVRRTRPYTNPRRPW